MLRQIHKEDIKVNMIFVGEHGWMANAIESGSRFNYNNLYRVEDRVVKFMLFLYNHFDFKYTMKLKDYQMKQPLILLH